MARQTVRPATKPEVEHEALVAYLHGMDSDRNIVHLLVHKKGTKVRFTGGIKSHNVASQNSSDLPSWVREAQTACGLAEVLGMHRGSADAAEYFGKITQLKARLKPKTNKFAASAAL